jgi:hypothetical protein
MSTILDWAARAPIQLLFISGLLLFKIRASKTEIIPITQNGKK